MERRVAHQIRRLDRELSWRRVQLRRRGREDPDVPDPAAILYR